MSGEIRAYVRQCVPEVDYLAAYPCTVITQSADQLTVDVRPDSSALPEMQAVPIRYGMPGMTALVSTGQRALLMFEGASPTAPVVVLWAASGLSETVALGHAVQSFCESLLTWLQTHTHAQNATPPTEIATLPQTGQLASSTVRVAT